jgi:hypothetical protein
VYLLLRDERGGREGPRSLEGSKQAEAQVKATTLIEIIQSLTNVSTQMKDVSHRDNMIINGDRHCAVNPAWLKEVADKLSLIAETLREEFEEEEVDLTKSRADHLKDREPVGDEE